MPENGVSVHVRALARAAELVGGVAELSQFIDVPHEELMRWMKGERPPDSKAFAAVIDILLEHDLGKFGKPARRPPKRS